MSDKYTKEIARLLQNRVVNKHDYDRVNITAAVVMIIKKISGEYYTLLIQRSVNNQDAFSGHMAFPGGKMQKEDKTLIHTAIRETYEEVGLSLNGNSSILGVLDDCRPNNPMAKNMVVTPFVTFLEKDMNVKIDNMEVADYVWIPVNDLYEQYLINLDKYGDQYNKKRFEYLYGDYFIWGLTGRIITQFMELTSDLYIVYK